MMILLKRIVFILVVQLVALSCCSVCAQTARIEAAYLQTDRTVYIAGESVFYKLYVLEADTKQRSERSKVGYVILRDANLNSSVKIRVKIDTGISSGSFILPDTLTSGVYQIVAFTADMKNYGEKHFFHKEIMIANRFDKELNFKLASSNTKESVSTKLPSLEPNIQTNKKVFGAREKVSVRLSHLNSKGSVAVSVFEDPKILSTNKSIVETLNGLVAASPDKKVLTGYTTENSGKILRGTVVDVTTNKNVSNATVLVSCIDTIPNLQYAITNSSGMFQMLLNNYYNGKELFLTIKDVPTNKHWKIKIEDEFAQPDKWNPSVISEKVEDKEYLLKSQNIVYINKSYPMKTDSIERPVSNAKFICPELYHCPVRTVYPSLFVPLDSLPEIAIELLPLVSINKYNGKYRAHIMNPTTSLVYNYNKEPAIFLDGVFVDDINNIISLGSEQIKKIDIVYTERIFGDLIFQGVISIISNSNEISRTIPAEQSQRLKNDTINTGKKFGIIDPVAIQNKNFPFFKQLLYWNPDIKINDTGTADLEFFTSDNTSDFIIRVEGISNDGTPYNASTGIQVNNQINTPKK